MLSNQMKDMMFLLISALYYFLLFIAKRMTSVIQLLFDFTTVLLNLSSLLTIFQKMNNWIQKKSAAVFNFFLKNTARRWLGYYSLT